MAVDVFADMNPPQREAIAQLDGALLVVAGAGSGKTRVITHRIANIIQHGTRPDRILAITFTNKAAGEMTERVERMLGLRTPWITTFHSAGLRMLKLVPEKLGMAHPFTVLDVDDQKKLLRRVVDSLGLDPKVYEPKKVAWRLSQWKNRLLPPDKISPGDERDVDLQTIYRRYLELTHEECVLDFDDLLMRPVQLLREDPAWAEELRVRFPYILIDEYQDTNHAQYELVRILGAHGNVCATGDPDQAIYGWRGADYQNIMSFSKDFAGCRTIKLEQNYRSTGLILQAAQAVVENNHERLDKTIFTANAPGEPLRIITVDDEQDEAMAVAAAVDRLRREGRRLGDIAIFYRTNVLSRIVEEYLIRRGIPYRLVGGTRFYDRAEVKDLLSYLKLMINPRDLSALNRIVNVPRRGVGERTLELLREMAWDEGVAPLEVLMTPDLLERVAVGRARKPLCALARDLARLLALDRADAGDCVERVLDCIPLEDHHLDHDPELGLERCANLREVQTAAEQFTAAGGGGLEAFLDHISLLTSEDERRSHGTDQLTLMTLHASKGLEFPVVFIIGVEQGLLPLLYEGRGCDYEEERRLMYVGITRAMEQVYLSHTVTRSQYGRSQRNPPSMFLAEIPDDCIEHRQRARRGGDSRAAAGPSYPADSLAHLLSGGEPVPDGEAVPSRPSDLNDLRGQGLLTSGAALRSALRGRGVDVGTAAGRREEAEREREPIALAGDPYLAGQQVMHAVFGAGRVLRLEGSPDDRRILVDFERVGVKELIARLAGGNLRAI